MVRPCAKYARLNCYAPLQVTAKTFAVTWSGLFTCAKLATFFGLGLGTCKTKYFYRNCCAPKTSDGKSVVGIFSACLIHAPRYYYGLVLGRIGGVFYAGASLRRQLKTAEGIDHFSSALPLGRGFHSPLWRQTANNGTSWRLICASRARSRAGARLGRTSRACSPPTCTILRRLIKLVCALLRFRERSRTIKVQLATSSSQNHRKSFTQSCLVLSIKYRH